MELLTMISMRPFTFFFLLTFGVLLLPSIVIPYWHHTIKKIEHDVDVDTHYVRSGLISEIDYVSKVILPINSSATNLAQLLASTFDGKNLSFSDIEAKVAPALFEAIITIPYATQVSYISKDGLFFSYYKSSYETISALYSNTTFKLSPYIWYTSAVNPTNGSFFGYSKTLKSPRILPHESWFQRALTSPNGLAHLGSSWTHNGGSGEPLFLNTAPVATSGIGTGVVSIGYPIMAVREFLFGIRLNGAGLYMVTVDDGKVVAEVGMSGVNVTLVGGSMVEVQVESSGHGDRVPCESGRDDRTKFIGGPTLEIGGKYFTFYCSPIQVAGVQSVYVLAFESKGIASSIRKMSILAVALLVVMVVVVTATIGGCVAMIVRFKRREVHLCAAYIKQMEQTQEAERKSMRQSLTFASVNHDVRGLLACILGWVSLASSEVPPQSSLGAILRRIHDSAVDLQALTTSILDVSKIEAGMMQLEEKEFQLAQLLEDVADLHYPVAMKKGIDVLLDPSDSSITRISHVKGDPGKLKQILCNLLSNAVKFTSVGHVLIRARARKPSLENSIIASNKQNGILNRVSRLFYKNKQAYEDLEQLRSIKQNANCMEFVFEVEDTGPGIPKEKRKSVFENFVQVKETAAGQLGTGLGLGIVQSLVRLMGGDIEVVDKEDGSCGTCCRFNIFLIVCGINPSLDHSKQGNLERGGSSGLSTCGPSPKTEGSAVVLLMHSDGRRKMVHRYMEGLGLRVLAIKQARHLPRVLKKLKTKLTVTQYSSSSGKSDYVSSSSDQRSKFYPLSAMDGADEMLPVHHLRANLRGAVKHALLLIDTNAGEFSEICRAVAEFRKDLYRTCCCNVIWLERPDTRGVHGLQEENLPPTDHVISEPLHGSRLLQVVRYLPEFEGSFVKVSTNRKRGTTDIGSLEIQQEEIEELGNSSSDISLSRWKIVGDDDHGEIRERESSSDDKYFTITNGRNSREKKILAAEGKRAQQAETEELVRGRRSLEEKVAESQDVQEAATPKLGGLNPKGPLTGKRVLIAEDTELLAKLAVTVVSRLDAMVERCKNGKEAVELVGKGLGEQACYNFILMDCQMPVMDGFEATKEIRKEEKKYGVHIPIIALTAHTAEEEGKKIVEAGMDFHLTKPLNKDRLLDALRIIHENQA